MRIGTKINVLFFISSALILVTVWALTDWLSGTVLIGTIAGIGIAYLWDLRPRKQRS